jgi:hypothetical protein
MVPPVTIDIINKDLNSDRLWRERRHPLWTLNYELSRDTVIVNRLTQRQSVNVSKSSSMPTVRRKNFFARRNSNSSRIRLTINPIAAPTRTKMAGTNTSRSHEK